MVLAYQLGIFYFYRMNKLPLILFAVIIVRACSPASPETSQEHLLQATLWYQHSAEKEALYLQSFHWAGRLLDEKLSTGKIKAPAVVLDIDETILDNSPQTARQIIENRPYSDAMWDEWCSLAAAEALPGALEFVSKAKQLGVEVFYISNRGIHLMEYSLSNLRSAGFPFADTSHVLLKTDTSVKDARRAQVASSHEILLLIGDNLGDFSGIFDEREQGAALEHVREKKELFGDRYIMLPNPMYGSWEKPFRVKGETLERKKDALNAYRLQNE